MEGAAPPAPTPRPRRTAASLLWSPRVRAVWLLAAAGWGLFAGFRAGLLIASGPLVENVSAADIARCFLTGLRYDAMPIGYALLPLALALSLAPAATFAKSWFRRAVVVYAVVVTTLAVFAEIVGAAFFMHFGSRLNWIALDYFGHFREIGAYIWKAYPIAFFPLALAVLIYGCVRLFRRVFWGVPGGTVAARSALAAVLVCLCVLGARGGLDTQTLNSSSAYFCENNVVSQLTMNNFCTFSQSAILHMEDGQDESELYPLPKLLTAQRVAAWMFYQPHDVPLDVPGNPLWRRTETQQPRADYNVVVIVMEGMSGTPVGALGHDDSQTPQFDALCRQGLFFERMYGVGSRTSRGMTGVLCGFPDLTGPSVLKRDRSQGTFLTLPLLLQQRGYRTMFVYGGDPEFDNMQAFFAAGGVDEFISQTDMRSDSPPGNWGMPDEVIFRKAHERFQKMGDKPFFAAILTVSNHEPYDVPPGRVDLVPPENEEQLYLNGYRYADWALGEFFRQASQAEYFKRTIFVLVADHCRDRDRSQLVDLPQYRVPCLFYAPGLVEARRTATVGSQTDIAPTLLAMLGGSYEHCFFGRDLLNVAEDDGFAFMQDDDRLAFVRGRQAVIMPPRQAARLYGTDERTMAPLAIEGSGDLASRLQLEMLSSYQMARRLYLARAYRSPTSTRRRVEPRH